MSPARYLGPEPLIEPEPAAVKVTGVMAGGMLGHQRPDFLEVVAELGGELLLDAGRVAGLAVAQSP